MLSFFIEVAVILIFAMATFLNYVIPCVHPDEAVIVHEVHLRVEIHFVTREAIPDHDSSQIDRMILNHVSCQHQNVNPAVALS